MTTRRYEVYTVPQVYCWMAGSALAGAVMLAFCIFLWLASHDFFLIPKEEAVKKAYWNEVYTRIEVCPIDEEAGNTTKENER